MSLTLHLFVVARMNYHSQQTRMSPKQIHEVTNTDSVIRAHGSGACYGYTAKQVWSMDSRAESVDVKDIEFPRNRDTANEVLSTVTEYLTQLNDMCDAPRPSSTTLATQITVHNHVREKVGWKAGFHGWKAQKSRET